jgi:tetratricopeptide (TPR) repeat protein
MRFKHIVLPASTKIRVSLSGERHRGRVGIACDWLLLLVCIIPALWRGCDVHAQQQSRAQSGAQSGAGLSPNTSLPAAPQPAPHGAPSAAMDALLAQARAAVQAGSFSSAEAMVGKYLSRQDASADGHYLLGYILSHQGKARESLAEYTRAAQLRPPTANDLKVVAVDYVLLGDFVDADRWLTKALSWNPSDADGWYYLGRTKYNENRFTEAIDAFQKCLRLDAHNVKAEDNLGLSYEGLNQTQPAIQAFQTAIAWQTDASKKDAQPYLNLGTLLTEQEQETPDAGLVYLQEAVALAPQNAKTHEQLGRAYLKLKRWKDSQSELEKAVQLAPDSSSLHYQLGVNYRDQGLKDLARKEFDRCTELNGMHSSADTPNQ